MRVEFSMSSFVVPVPKTKAPFFDLVVVLWLFDFLGVEATERGMKSWRKEDSFS